MIDRLVTIQNYNGPTEGGYLQPGLNVLMVALSSPPLSQDPFQELDN